MYEREEIRDATLHDILLEGNYCVTFKQTCGDTTTMSFSCFPTKSKAMREISHFKLGDAWRELARS